MEEIMNTFKTFVRALKIMKKNLFIFLAAIVAMTAFSSLFEVADSVFARQVMDYAGQHNISEASSKLTATTVLGIASVLVASIFMDIYNNKAKWATLELKKQVFSKTLKMPMQYYDEHHSAEMIAMSIYDTDVASNIYSSRLRRVIAPVISVAVFTIAMFVMNPVMAIIMLTVNIALFILNTLLANPVKQAGKKLSDCNALMTEQLSDITNGAIVNKIYDACGMRLKKYEAASRLYVSAQKKKMRLTAISEAINNSFDIFCALMFVIAGIILAQTGIATIGETAGIYAMYTMLSFRFLQLGKNYPELMNCIAYAAKIFKFLDETEEPSGKEKNIDGFGNDGTVHSKMADNDSANIIQNAIEIKNITYHYKNDIPVIHNKSYAFPRNHFIALTGKSGRGKSTLAKLILGYYPLQGGQICVFGKSTDELGIDVVRRTITYIPQESYLFEISIMDNIRCACPDASNEDVVTAAKLANAHEFIENLENGYHTIIRSRENNLSGGERQRIAIARAIIRNTPIIIMDEATSALDNESERLVTDAIKKIASNKTVIMVAHRQTTIDKAHIVVEM